MYYSKTPVRNETQYKTGSDTHAGRLDSHDIPLEDGIMSDRLRADGCSRRGGKGGPEGCLVTELFTDCFVFHVHAYATCFTPHPRHTSNHVIPGHPACFLGALQLCASKAGKPHAADNALVHVNAYLGHPNPTPVDTNGKGENGVGVVEGPGAAGVGQASFGLKVDITVEGLEDGDDGIIQAAHYVSEFILGILYWRWCDGEVCGEGCGEEGVGAR